MSITLGGIIIAVLVLGWACTALCLVIGPGKEKKQAEVDSTPQTS